MASGYGRKQTFGQKVKGTLRRVFTLSVLGATFVGAPAYYEYGTMKTAEVKIKDVQSNWVRWDSSKGEAVYNYKLVTDQGKVFNNENSLLHFKFNSKDIQDQINAGRNSYQPQQSSIYDIFGNSNNDGNSQQQQDPANDPANKVYRISYYGELPLINNTPNILSVQEVSKEELQARAKAAADARKAAQQAQKQAQKDGQPANGNAAATPAGASNALVTYDTVVNGQDVNLTVPADAVSKVKVNSVTPIIPKAPGN